MHSLWLKVMCSLSMINWIVKIVVYFTCLRLAVNTEEDCLLLSAFFRLHWCFGKKLVKTDFNIFSCQYLGKYIGIRANLSIFHYEKLTRVGMLSHGFTGTTPCLAGTQRCPGITSPSARVWLARQVLWPIPQKKFYISLVIVSYVLATPEAATREKQK